MKKKLYSLACILFTGVSCMFGQTLSVADVTMPQNKPVMAIVGCTLDQNKDLTAFQFDISFKKNESATSDLTIESSNVSIRFHGTNHTKNFSGSDGHYTVTVHSGDNSTIPNSQSTLLQFEIGSNGNQTIGDTYEATLSNIVLSYVDQSQDKPADVTFNVTVGSAADWDILLDENSAVPPTTTDGEKEIKVNRTMKKGLWSTICLPFNMTEQQVKDAFGEGTQLAEFYDYTPTKDGDNVVSISVDFHNAQVEDENIYLYSNYPYIIKATKDVEAFTLETSITDVDLQTANSYTQKAKKPIGMFIGNYVADTTVPENSLFINDNKFYYSTGKTKMKAFRAYFTFNDILSSAVSAGARISFSVDGEDTKVEDAEFIMTENGRIYSISGQYRGMSNENKNLPKGLYIMNGKKMIVK